MAGLAELLAEQLLGCAASAPDGVPRRVILWLDPERGFQRLWPHVARRLEERSVRALICAEERDQLGVKVELLRVEAAAGVTAVVYLPGFDVRDLAPRPDGTAPTLWSVYDQRYKGAFFSLHAWQPGEVPEPPTLADWLASVGARLDGDALDELTEGGPDSLLARYAELNADRDPAAWPAPLTLDAAVAALGGDPRDALRELIAAPTNALGAWGERRELVLGGIASVFGIRPPEGEPGPEELADAVVLQLALAEAWDAFGRPANFPFRSRLPEGDEPRERCARFLREDILPHRELAPRYRDRIQRLEKDVDLSGWAAGRAGLPRGLPLLARGRWRAFLERFDGLAREDWRRARELLAAAADEIVAGRGSPWDGPDGDTAWFVLDDARSLAERCSAIRTELEGIGSSAEIAAAFAARWWEADRRHLAVRAACGRIAGLEQVRRVADLTYFEYVSAVNDRFAELLEAEGSWPPPGAAAVSTLSAELWTRRSGRRAVIVTDALRLDLARDLAGALGAELTPVFSTIPTITPFGMTALLPLAAEDVAVAFEKGVVLTTREGTKVSTRDGRKELLARRDRRDERVAFMDLEALLRGEDPPDAGIVVVFDDTIDSQGHEVPEELPGLAEALVGKLRRAAERLHERGVAEVHVVTDHGFLLLPADLVDGLGRPEVGVSQVMRREARWCALKPGAPVEGLLRFRLPFGSEEILLGFPRGVRTFVAASEFLHGGISVQECVIPHVVSRVDVEAPRLEVEVAVRVPELATGTVPVVVRPLPAGLFGQRAVRLRLWVEPAAGGEPVTDPVELEVRPDAEELKPPLYLKEGVGLRVGAELVLRAVEVETGREVAGVPLRMAVDWD